jgi:TonB-dependent receptor
MLPGITTAIPLFVAVGNPNLKPYFSNNIDLGVELYTGDEGYFGITAFRKSLNGFTVEGLITHPFSDLAPYGITYASFAPGTRALIDAQGGPALAKVQFDQQVNASGLLTVSGLELNWVQPLDFLLTDYGFKGFGFTANLTIVDQKGSGAAPATAVGVSPYTYNLVGYYEDHGLSVRVTYVYNDKQQTTSFNQSGIPAAAVYTDGYGQMDLSASYKLAGLLGKLPSDLEITFDVQNVLDASPRSYFQYESATFSHYNPGHVFMFGVRGTF